MLLAAAASASVEIIISMRWGWLFLVGILNNVHIEVLTDVIMLLNVLRLIVYVVMIIHIYLIIVVVFALHIIEIFRQVHAITVAIKVIRCRRLAAIVIVDKKIAKVLFLHVNFLVNYTSLIICIFVIIRVTHLYHVHSDFAFWLCVVEEVGYHFTFSLHINLSSTLEFKM